MFEVIDGINLGFGLAVGWILAFISIIVGFFALAGAIVVLKTTLITIPKKIFKRVKEIKPYRKPGI